MIQLNMPGFYQNGEIAFELFELLRQYPEVAYSDTKIVSLFDTFPNMIWNGGGCHFGRTLDISEVKNIVYTYNQVYNMPIRFTFTNPMLQEKHLQDTYCNLVVEACENGFNEILTSSPILEKYLKTHYPNYKYMRSIIATENGNDFSELDNNNVELVVLKRIKNNDWDYLNTIPQKYRSKIEILCNDTCTPDCPRLYSHYKEYGVAQLTYNRDLVKPCSQKPDPFFLKTLQSNPTFVNRDMIVNKYYPNGFINFKIAGRSSRFAFVENINNYLIKPEYHADIRHILYGRNI